MYSSRPYAKNCLVGVAPPTCYLSALWFPSNPQMSLCDLLPLLDLWLFCLCAMLWPNPGALPMLALSCLPVHVLGITIVPIFQVVLYCIKFKYLYSAPQQP